MRVQVFTQGQFTWEGYISPDDGDTDRFLDEVLIHFSREERPNAKIRPPMQSGDLVTLIGGPRELLETHRYTGSGFRKVTLKLASTMVKLDLLHEQRRAGVRSIPRLPRLKEIST